MRTGRRALELSSLRRSLHKVGVFLPLLVFMVWTLLPLVWSLSASFKPVLELWRAPPTLIPRQFTWQNYINVFQFQYFWTVLMNSVYLALASTVITVAVSTLAGYSFARFTFPFKHVLLLAILVPRIIPRAALVVPLYRMFSAVGLLDTYTVLIISYAASAIPMSTWILSGFFESIPRSIEESARLDGARLPAIMTRILLPMALPGLITVIIVSTVMAWNEFPFVLAFTTSARMRTLPYQLFLMLDSLGLTDWSLMNAFTMVTVIPIVVVFLIFQRRVVKGLVGGAVK